MRSRKLLGCAGGQDRILSLELSLHIGRSQVAKVRPFKKNEGNITKNEEYKLEWLEAWHESPKVKKYEKAILKEMCRR